MSKPTRKVTLAIAEADAALTILKSVIAERIHEDDRKEIDALIDKALRSLNSANYDLSDARRLAASAFALL